MWVQRARWYSGGRADHFHPYYWLCILLKNNFKYLLWPCGSVSNTRAAQWHRRCARCGYVVAIKSDCGLQIGDKTAAVWNMGCTLYTARDAVSQMFPKKMFQNPLGGRGAIETQFTFENEIICEDKEKKIRLNPGEQVLNILRNYTKCRRRLTQVLQWRF